jgi:hypothetical protein
MKQEAHTNPMSSSDLQHLPAIASFLRISF